MQKPLLPNQVVALPSRTKLALDVTHHLAEAVLIPLGLFYGIVVVFGLNAALLAATGITVLKVAITYLSNSATTYFVQPTLMTFLFAAALLVSLAWERPLIQQLANDFCPLPLHVTDSIHIQHFFRRLSVLWGMVLIVNASTTLALLLTSTTLTSVPLSAAASIPPFVAGLLISAIWFRDSLRDGGFELSWG